MARLMCTTLQTDDTHLWFDEICIFFEEKKKTTQVGRGKLRKNRCLDLSAKGVAKDVFFFVLILFVIASLKHRDFPALGRTVMSQNVNAMVLATDFIIMVVL
jgi:hypothetical protein